ncbi:hypothetical protein LYZ96_18410, partial [Xanthomonas hortorum pv. vitians]|uniref:hypothetical protein n=1 Tax=Xanthomonas hortorum TaxID=56454 RepID=UPI001F4380A7
IVRPGPGGWMTWATPLGGEVAQVRSPGPLHNRWCCESELKPPRKIEMEVNEWIRTIEWPGRLIFGWITPFESKV